jgi:hypothetical protein
MAQPPTEELIQQMTTHISQFKEMSHRAKLRIEKLAEMSLVIEDDLKQKNMRIVSASSLGSRRVSKRRLTP